ncbi:alpha/beta-hydrolase [Hyaloscypha variabilis F]|uniref:Carboxypeptidase n=1 Tax=Hyaloscypha variabilis (strain UAMH 11265 / GT02V1 / F) TaxID=1149755 RepID=A0A2J6R5A7_HYAVF|nr:alpha/beta-hydrolase [Hyaloscypha variabilis F]
MFSFQYLLLFAGVVVGSFSNQHEKAAKYSRKPIPRIPKRDAPGVETTSLFLNNKTSSFAVNASALPEVTFPVGESYAGTLPITPISSNTTDPNQLWFWFFPSSNPLAKNEIVIWLNGGPGCSSLFGMLQENGPFLWQPGTYQPIPNPYSWTNLTNIIYIDQPVSTGYSTGNISVNNEQDVTTQFMGFWENFIDLFSMQGYKIYIAGESYAGQYIPYIASGFLDAKDEVNFNLKGIQINDPSINYDDTMTQAAVVPALQYYQNIINLNETFMANITKRAETCGYTEFFNKYTTSFPPPGPIPTPPNSSLPGCDLYDDVYNATYFMNPCFNIYHLVEYCPYLYDQLGFPSLGGGPNNYFNRTDVQKILNAPVGTNFYVCGGGPNLFPNGDSSPPSALGPLPSVIERTNKTIIGHGLLDFLLFANGSLITIQNMTWNGAQGFQSPPSSTMNFFVPYHQSLDYILSIVNDAIPDTAPQYDTAGAGIQGTWHTERGLTWVTVPLAGHEIPQYTPGAAYRMLEFLLERIENLSVRGDYTTQTGNFSGT